MVTKEFTLRKKIWVKRVKPMQTQKKQYIAPIYSRKNRRSDKNPDNNNHINSGLLAWKKIGNLLLRKLTTCSVTKLVK